jgi:hypothetical protein
MGGRMNLDSIPGEIEALSRRMSRIEERLDQNTALTLEVRDALIAGRFIARMVAWAAPLVAVAASIWTWIKDDDR